MRTPDGSLVLAGDDTQAGNVYTIGRAGADGAQVFVRGVATGAGASFYAVTSQSDGRIVAAGHTTDAGVGARVERVDPAGGIDTTFGTSGAAVVNAATLYAAAIDGAGRILVAGNASQAGGVIVRLWP